MEGAKLTWNPDQEEIVRMQMYGLIRNDHNTVRVANRIFETRRYNLFLSEEELKNNVFSREGELAKNQFITDGKLKGCETMQSNDYGLISVHDRYTKFAYRDTVITFMHGKDLIKYLAIKEWDNGYLVVDCLGKVKGEFEDYIDLAYIMRNLYMDPEESLRGIKEVRIDYA